MLPRVLAVSACVALLLAAHAAARPDPGPPSGCSGCRKVTGEGVRVRTGPCTDETILGLKYPGDKVTHTCTTLHNSCGHDWAEVEYEGGTAWMAAEFLKPC